MAVATAAIAAAGLAYAAYSGERAQDQQQDARRRTQRAQDEALRVQMIERQRTVQQQMEAANRPSPASTIQLTDELLASTDRTGGVDDRLRLSRATRLGG